MCERTLSCVPNANRAALSFIDVELLYVGDCPCAWHSEKLRGIVDSDWFPCSETPGVAGGCDRCYESLGSPRSRGEVGPRRVNAPELEEGGAPAEHWRAARWSS